MFFVFNKDKIYAYIVSVLTVCFLFFIASFTSEKVVETSTNTSVIYNQTENNYNNIVMNNTGK